MKSPIKVLLAGFVAALLVFGEPAFATSQEPDTLVLDGEQLSLETNPLKPLIQSGQITLPEPDEQWSSNLRGYVATWIIEDRQLFLVKLAVRIRPEGAMEGAEAVPTNVLTRVFTGQAQVAAEWFSGTLVVPRGEVVEYVHMGYGSVYERYTVIQVQSGRVVSQSDLSARDYESLRKVRFAAYQRTTEYAARLKQAREGLSESAAERLLYEFAVEEYMSVAQ